MTMIQDLEYGRMENEFHTDRAAKDDDHVLCFRGGEVLFHRDGNEMEFPTLAKVKEWQKTNNSDAWFDDNQIQYVFRLQDIDYYIFMGSFGDCPDPDFKYAKIATVRKEWPEMPRNKQFCMMTAWHLYNWYRSSRFCGKCGAKTVHDSKERMMRCPECGNMIFPRINPAVIVITTNGDKCLLTKSSVGTGYGAVAGFIEIGETAEEAVAREVMEECGVRVKNVRYYKSQPWGVAGNLSIGYFCDLDGDSELHIDYEELTGGAEWVSREDIPEMLNGISLTYEMMEVFKAGLEPKA